MNYRPSVLALDAPSAHDTSAKGWQSRLHASACHLGLSIVAAALVLALVQFLWYRNPLNSIAGVGEIVLLLIAVDAALGPLLTLIVFDRRKKSLPFDLACVGTLQLIALLYGLHVIEAGRPHYLVFVKDRFEVVSKTDLRQEDRDKARANLAAAVDWFGPRIVAAEMPASEEERGRILFEAVFGGRDIQHYPKQYRDYASQASVAAAKAQSLTKLRALNPDDQDALDDAVARSGVAEASLKFLPVKGPVDDAAMLVDASSGAIMGMVGLRPWR